MLETQIQRRHSRLVSQSPFFYGWVIVAVASLGLVMTSPAQTYAISIFIEYFIDELNLSRSFVSTLYSVASLVAGISLTLIGHQIDRYGARLMMVMMALISGLACIYMGFVNGATMLFLGFLALRITGQGGLTLVSQNVINQWWVQRRGTMTGISGVLLSLLGIAGFPNLINWLIPLYGWRGTFMVEGLIYLVLMVPLAWIFLRNYPEEYDLQPDGRMKMEGQPASTNAKDSTQSTASVLTAAEEPWTLNEAIGSVAFWVVGLGVSTMAMATTGLFFHMVSIFEDSGLKTVVLGQVYVLIAVITALMTLFSGILIDYFPARLLLSAALIAQTLSLVTAAFLFNTPLAFVYGAFLGITFGLTRTVIGVIWAIYYGRQHLGSISGAASTIMLIGASLGPLPYGYGRDLSGDYQASLLLTALLPLALGLANLFVDKPQRHP